MSMELSPPRPRQFTFEQMPIHGSYFICAKEMAHKDERGLFVELHRDSTFMSLIKALLVQTNLSTSKKGVARGMHFQTKSPQGKLVRCLGGSIYDMLIDLRKESPTYMRALGRLLTDDCLDAIWVPPGCAHGFVAVEDAVVLYQCSNEYEPSADRGVQIPQDLLEGSPYQGPFLQSERDRGFPTLGDYLETLG